MFDIVVKVRPIVVTVVLGLFLAFSVACNNQAPATVEPTEPVEEVPVEPTEPVEDVIEEPVVVEVPEPTEDDPGQVLGQVFHGWEETREMFAGMTFQDSPFLHGRGLPPVEERLPLVPKFTNDISPENLDFQIGQFGGTLRTVTSVVDWDADVFIAINEPLLNSPDLVGREVTGNIFRGFDVSEDQTEFIFYLREGMRWSDGEPLTMEDIRFTIEDLIFNTQYTQNVPPQFRSGGARDGTPMIFEIIDDWSFRLTFDRPYGGFLIRLATTGWVGYSELLVPSHFLRRFHPDHATAEEQAQWEVYIDRYSITRNIANPELTWVNVMNHFRILNNQATQRRAIGFPTLRAWELVSATDTLWVYERNPFFFKVDAAGNQLPYIDRIESTLVQDMEMVQLMAIAGEVDFMRESAALINMPLYRQNEESGGFTTLMVNIHNTPTTIHLNLTWAGGTDGYREMVQDVRFRRALNMAIDPEIIIDAIYFGYAEPNTWQDATFDPEGAIALLEDMGMVRGADGWFLQPDGDTFQIIIEHGAEAPDIGPYSELVTEMWRDIGINASTNRLAGALVGQRQNANELQARVIWVPTPLWGHMNWGFPIWGRSWEMWLNSVTEITYTDDDGNTVTRPVAGETPPEDVQEFYRMVESLMSVSTDQAQIVFDNIRQHMDENVWFMVPLVNMRQPVIVNNRLRNTTDHGFGIALNYSMPQVWFEQD